MLTLLTLAAMVSASTVAHTPFVDSLFVPVQTPVQLWPVDEYEDIPGTVKILDLPAGTAVIQWALSAKNVSYNHVRPAIGDTFPEEGLRLYYGLSDELHAGSWSAHTDGGLLPVRLQVKGSEYHILQERHPVSWTITVYPDEGDIVPAVSSIGLMAMTLLVMSAGGWIVLKRMA